MYRLLSLIIFGIAFFSAPSIANDENLGRWQITEKDDPFSNSVKLSVHVEYRTTDSETSLPVYVALDIAPQPNPHSSMAAIGLISHLSPMEPQPINSPARVIRLSVDDGDEISLPAYFQTDRGSAFGTKHWYLFDIHCRVLSQLAQGDSLRLDTPEVSTLKLSGAARALRQVVPRCFNEKS